MLQPNTKVSIAVIIPVYKHSEFVVEAISSALRQRRFNQFAIVLVNDGCPYADTHMTGLGACGSKAPLYYLRQPNSGLSAARNTGIRFALRTFPELDAVYLLDADNRLTSFSLANCAAALDAYPEKDWFYPDVSTIGHRMRSTMAGPYSASLHTNLNFCEAGSLIRKRVFLAGNWFDEEMKLGYEDWEFWLSATTHGFRGMPLASINYRYRRRAESMLTSSDRNRNEIIAYMQRKHPWLKSVRALARLSQQESKRFGIVTEKRVILLNSPKSEIAETAFDDFSSSAAAWACTPSQFSFPSLLLFTTECNFAFLQDSLVATWFFWKLQTEASKHPTAGGFLQFEKGCEYRVLPTSPKSAPHFIAVSASILREVLNDSNTEWFERQLEVTHQRSFTTLLGAKEPVQMEHFSPDVARLFMKKSIAHRSNIPRAIIPSLHTDIPDQSQVSLIPSKFLQGGFHFPLMRRHSSEKHIAFVLPFVSFGGVEKVAFQVARTLRSEDIRVHLVSFSEYPIFLPDECISLFDTISWVPGTHLPSWNGFSYLGTNTSNPLTNELRRDALGLLSLYDVVFNCHSPDFHLIAGFLRDQKITLIDYQHVVEVSEIRRPHGHPFLGLAYNHIYDLTVTCSRTLARWFHGHGVPHQRIIPIVNGPGFQISEELSKDAVERRRARYHTNIGAVTPLRILYFGRLDYQKGTDRLNALYRRFESDCRFEWRVVGKSVLKDEKEGYGSLSNILEEPVFDSEGLSKLLSNTDIFLLPSRYEGLPLSIIEAMRFGCVVIATAVGAVEEIIDNQKNGYFFEEELFVPYAENLLLELAASPSRLLSISGAAAQSSKSFNWTDSTRELRKYLWNHVDDGQ